MPIPQNRVGKNPNKYIKYFGIASNARFFVCALMIGLQISGSIFGLGSVSISELFAIPTAHAAEGINQAINYQGKLMDSTGNPVADGNYNIKFTLYSAGIGGTQLWTASSTNGLPAGVPAAVSVSVVSGLFSLLLGDVSNNQVAFPEGLFNNDNLYLGVTIGADSEMTPRKRLSAVPYAFNSETLQGQYASNTVANTGGDLFALRQASADAAASTRTALYIETKGTSNLNDFLIRASDSISDVFTVSRQGNVTTTGNLTVNGSTKLNNTLNVSATSTLADLALTGRVNSDLLPYITDTYLLGNSTYRWLGVTAQNINAVNVSSTNIDALGYVSTTNLYSNTALLGNVTSTNLYNSGVVSTTSLYVNGVAITGAGATPTWQQVTDVSATTNDWIQFAGATSTENIVPSLTNSLTLGTSVYQWANIFSQSANFTYVSTTNLDASGYIVTNNLTATNADLTNVSSTNIDASGYISADTLISNTANLGNVTTTNLYNSGTVSTTQLYVNGVAITGIESQDFQDVTDLGVATTNWIQFAGATSTNHFLPGTNNLFNLGSIAYRWANLFAVNGNFTGTVTTTNLFASGYVSTTNLYVNGTQITGATPTLQNVTDEGYITNDAIGFAGASSTGNVLPTTNLAYDLGSSSNRWKDVWASSTRIGTSTWEIWQSNQGLTFSENFIRKLTIAHSGNVGIGVNDPGESLELNGAIRLGTTSNNTTGNVRWDGSDFTGYDGTSWKSLTGLSDVRGEATGFPNRTDTIISFTTSTRTFSIAPTGASFDFYYRGSKFTKNSAETFQITDTEGTWTFYFDSAGILQGAQSFPGHKNAVIVAHVYWDAADNAEIVLGDERHGLSMDADTHTYLHKTVGTRYNSGLSLTASITGTGNSNVDAETAITGGIIFDEDLQHTIVHSATPTNIFEQNLGTTGGGVVTSPAKIPVYYRSGASGYWRKIAATAFPVYGNGTSTPISYNNPAGPWTVPPATSGYFVAAWIIATNNINEPVIAIVGQRQDNTIATARSNNTYDSLSFGSLPFEENKVLYRLIFETKNSFNNGVGARIVDIQDLRSVTNLPGGTYVATAHGALSGLSNDDHTQYFLSSGRTGGQIAYGGINASENLILDSTSDVTKGKVYIAPTGGNVLIGTDSTQSLFSLQVAGNVGPSSTASYDLGSSSYRWRDIFSSRNVYASGTVQGATMRSYGALSADGAATFNGTIALGDATADTITANGYFGSNLIPSVNNTYTLGTAALRWKNLYATNVSSTNIDALGYVSTTNLYSSTGLLGNVTTTNIYNSGIVSTTQLYVNGVAATGIESQDLQDVTNLGAVTTDWIQFAGATSTNHFLPGTNNLFNLGSTAYRWANLFAVNGNFTGTVTTTNLFASGYVSTTSLYVNGTQITGATPTLQNVTDEGYITNDAIGFAGASSTGHLLPTANITYDLGSTSFRWRNLYASNGIFTNVSSTNIDALGYVSTTNLFSNIALLGNVTTTNLYNSGVVSTTALYVNGTQITGNGGASSLQQVTDVGNITNDWIEFAGGTSTDSLFIEGSADVPQLIVQENSTQSLTNKLIEFRDSAGAVIGGIHTNDSSNIFTGLYSGDAITTGINNSFYGSESGEFVTSGQENTAVGSQALFGNYDNITGSYNTAVGAESMYGYGGAAISGDNNTGVGFQSLTSLTTGYSNTGIGYYALRLTTTGYENIGLGYTALQNNTTGYKNIGIGAQALYSNVTGTANVAIGHEALYNNFGDSNVALGKNASYIGTWVDRSVAIGEDALFTNTIDENVAVGYRAVRANNTGARLTGIGKEAMVNNSTGSNNTAMGFESLYYNVSGSNNTAYGTYALYGNTGNSFSNNTGIGYYALYDVTTGPNNTALGSGALSLLSTGASNTAIGYNAGANITTGSNNITIGSGINAVSAAGNNQLNIGNALYGDLSTGFIGIGDSSPAALFTVGSGDLFQVNSSGRVLANVGASGAGNLAYSFTGDTDTGFYRSATNEMTFQTGATSRISINSNGRLTALGSANTTQLTVRANASQTNANPLVVLETSAGAEMARFHSDSGTNIFVGLYSGLNNNITGGGSENSFFGTQSGYSNTSGNNNTVVGASALFHNQTGRSNTAIGAGSMRGVFGSSTGDYNTAVGYFSLYNVTTGYYNVVLGNGAGGSISTGIGNVALGAYALSSVPSSTTGNYNVAIGSSSLNKLTTGANNIAMGQFAGSNITTGSSNIIIGNSVNAVSATGNNQLNIGNALYGDLSTGSLSIGTSTQVSLFNVAGTSRMRTILPETTLTYDLGSSSNRWRDIWASSTYIGTSTWQLKQDSAGAFTITNVNSGQDLVKIDSDGTLRPAANNTYYLGSDSYKWLGIEASNVTTTNLSVSGMVSTTELNVGGSQIIGGSSGMEFLDSGPSVMTPGSEILLNPSFTTDISNWSSVTCVWDSGNGGQAYCPSGSGAIYQSVNTTAGAYYYVDINMSMVGTKISITLTNAKTTTDSTVCEFTSSASDPCIFLSSNTGSNTFTVSRTSATLYIHEVSLKKITTTNSVIKVLNTDASAGGFQVKAGGIGMQNVFIGEDAALMHMTGASNTALGYGALQNHYEGTGNTAIGANAGKGLWMGSNNTFIGAGARQATGLLSANNMIMIGNTSVNYIGGWAGWTEYSDERIKEDILDTEIGLDFINRLRPRNFKKIDWDDRRVDGFIAQEVKQAMDEVGVSFSGYYDPALTDGAPADSLKSLSYGTFVVPLVNAVQEIYASSSPLWNGVAIDSSFAALEEPFMQVDQDGNIAYKGSSITSRGIAASTTQAFNSYTFSFKGSAWSSDTVQEITTSFDVFNNTISATSSELKFIYSTGTGFTQDLLTITNSGDVKVSGDLHVGRRLYLGSNTTGESSTSTYIFVDDTLSPTSTYIATNADGWQTESTYDYAERYESSDNLIPGDLVTVDSTGTNKVKRATSPSEPLMGIVSTKPGFVTGRHYDGWYPVALAGRVPTRVSTKNGSIAAGDYITASDIPGVGVKATDDSNVIGIALESYSSAEEGLISVFVKSIGNNAQVETNTIVYGPEAPVSTIDIQKFAMIKAGEKEVAIKYASVGAFPMVQITPYGSVNGGYWVTEVSDTGFKIVISEAQTHDLLIAYEVKLPTANDVVLSDGTIAHIDNLTGQITYPTDSTAETPTETIEEAIDVTDSEPPQEDPADPHADPFIEDEISQEDTNLELSTGTTSI